MSGWAQTLPPCAATITYEKVCAVGPRVPRIYRKNGEVVGISSDLDY